MSLNHVCIWANNGWKKITVEEAIQKTEYGASANSGLYMCELCGQYVALVKGVYVRPYFKHSRSEDDKSCIERSHSKYQYLYTGILNVEERGLPLKIVLKRNYHHFELGFPRLGNMFKKTPKNAKIIIKNEQGKVYNYSFERLDRDSITYFDVGRDISRFYTINTTIDNKEISFLWPKRISGVDKSAVFSAATGVMLPKGSDVVVNKEYYVLSDNGWLGMCSNKHIEVEEITSTFTYFLHLYKVKALDFSEASARFFLEINCRLTEKPISFVPIWPVVIKSPYQMYHNSDFLYGVMTGNATIQSYPIGFLYKNDYGDSQLLRIECKGRQQLLSLGRLSNVLSYSYLWREKPQYDEKIKTIEVQDSNGNQIDNLSNQEIQYIHFNSPYDGKFIVEEKGFVIEYYELTSESEFIYNTFKKGRAYKIYQGLDLVWKYESIPKKEMPSIYDDLILKKLKKCRAPYIKINHSYGKIINNFKHNYPKTVIWLRKQKNKGYLSKDAIAILNGLKNIGDKNNE